MDLEDVNELGMGMLKQFVVPSRNLPDSEISMEAQIKDENNIDEYKTFNSLDANVQDPLSIWNSGVRKHSRYESKCKDWVKKRHIKILAINKDSTFFVQSS